MSSLCKGKVSKGILKHTKHLLSLFRKWLHCNFFSFPEVEFIKTFWLVSKVKWTIMNSTSVCKFTRTLQVTNTLYAVLYQVQSSKYSSCRKWIYVGKNQTKQHRHLSQLICLIFICLWFGFWYCMFESVDCLWAHVDFTEEKCLVQKTIKCKNEKWSAS